MTQDALLVLLLTLIAAVPGLIAIWLWKRREETDKSQYDIQVKLRRQMQEQLDSQQQTIRFQTRRIDELEKSRAREFAESEILRQEMDDLRQEVGVLRRGVAVLTNQLQTAEIAPAWTPPTAARSKRVRDQAQEIVRLRGQIVEQFSLEEMNDLAFQMGVEPDELSGTTKRARARSLVSYMKDRERLDELVELLGSLRPEGDFE